jgi:hypothetical protein
MQILLLFFILCLKKKNYSTKLKKIEQMEQVADEK